MMSIRIKVKQSSKCKSCGGLGYYSFPYDKTNTTPVEYVCEICSGSGKEWEDKDLPLSSLKKLLK